jgi:hypothetical protein
MAILKPYKPPRRFIPRPENNLQRMVCNYLRLQFPNVIFRSDYAGVNNDSKASRGMMKSFQSSRSFPDLFIYEPKKVDGQQYAGMALELKSEGVRIKLKNGQLTANPHIREQYLMLQALNKKGYFADFGVGIDDCFAKIDWYMGKQKTENEKLPF